MCSGFILQESTDIMRNQTEDYIAKQMLKEYLTKPSSTLPKCEQQILDLRRYILKRSTEIMSNQTKDWLSVE